MEAEKSMLTVAVSARRGSGLQRTHAAHAGPVGIVPVDSPHSLTLPTAALEHVNYWMTFLHTHFWGPDRGRCARSGWGGGEPRGFPLLFFKKEKKSIQMSGKAVNTRSAGATERRRAAGPDSPGGTGTSPGARASNSANRRGGGGGGGRGAGAATAAEPRAAGVARSGLEARAKEGGGKSRRGC